jgi:uncharacterized OB-fold protein
MTNTIAYWRGAAARRAALGTRGSIAFLTEVRPAGEAPYQLAVIDVADGKRVLGRIADADAADLAVGRNVVAVIRRDGTTAEGLVAYGIKYRPE